MIRKLIRVLFVEALILRLSFRWLWINNLGDLVRHDGAIWTIVQANYGGGAAADLVSLDRTTRKDRVPREDFQKIMSPSNLLHSWRSAQFFYRTSWRSIWLQSGIEPWMLSCNIWGRMK